ncbi:hypothetical protein NR798_31935 [Archangium gephyra]|uniref:hypothetical protein n=1 Tax=Archangium gephyra TaxID=48 RepID=UPI0035D483A7
MGVKSFDTGDKVVGGGKYMRGIVTIDDGGNIHIRTHVDTHVKLAGFTGGLIALFSDKNGTLLHRTELFQYGVDGLWIIGKPSERWVDEFLTVDPSIGINTDRIDVIMGITPKNRLFVDLQEFVDIFKAISTVIELIGTVGGESGNGGSALVSTKSNLIAQAAQAPEPKPRPRPTSKPRPKYEP